MKAIKVLYFFLALFLYEIIKEFVFRVLSIIFYPIAFILRDTIIANMYLTNEALIKERTWKDTRLVSVGNFYKNVNLFYFFLWLFLDDSTAKDSYHKDNARMYNASDNDAHYPQWVIKANWYWLRATWWSFVRNNSVNFVSWNRTGGWIEPMQYETILGKYDTKIDKNDDNSYYYEGMYLIRVKHKDGKYHTRFTYVGEFLGKKQGIWLGFSKVSGRFSFSQRR